MSGLCKQKHVELLEKCIFWNTWKPQMLTASNCNFLNTTRSTFWTCCNSYAMLSVSVILFRFDLKRSFFFTSSYCWMFFVGKIMTHTNVTLAVRSEYYSGIKGRKNPKYCTGFQMPWNQFTDQRALGSVNERFFRKTKIMFCEVKF